MDIRALVVVVLLIPMVVGGLWIMPKLWRMEADIHKEEAATRWWPFGEALREGFLRAIPVGIIIFVFVELACAAILLEKLLTGEASRLARQLAEVFFVATLVGLLVDLSVHLFNWPKVVVPPAARHQPGAVVLWWSSRKYKEET